MSCIRFKSIASQIKLDKYSLYYFQSALFASVLEDTITELTILAECNNQLSVIKAGIDWSLLIAKKFSIADASAEFTDELDGIDPNQLAKDEYKLNKLINDRKLAKDVILNTYLNLCVEKSFKYLIEENERLIAADLRRITVVEEEARNRVWKREIFRQLRQSRIHIKSVTYENDSRIDELRREIEDLNIISEARGRYMDLWQKSRSEQNIQVIIDKEKTPIERINYYKNRHEIENRVHYEIEQISHIRISDILAEIEIWMNKYDKDIEEVDLKIQIMKNQYQNATDQRIELEEQFSKRAELIKNWVNFKEEREKARLYREKMTKSALCVQAWWRGFLVRQQLGPYKPAKKGAAKKKDKKK